MHISVARCFVSDNHIVERHNLHWLAVQFTPSFNTVSWPVVIALGNGLSPAQRAVISSTNADLLSLLDPKRQTVLSKNIDDSYEDNESEDLVSKTVAILLRLKESFWKNFKENPKKLYRKTTLISVGNNYPHIVFRLQCVSEMWYKCPETWAKFLYFGPNLPDSDQCSIKKQTDNFSPLKPNFDRCSINPETVSYS